MMTRFSLSHKSRYLLYWLEAMNLMREASESVCMINSLQTTHRRKCLIIRSVLLLVMQSDKSAELLNFLRDAKRFALRNRSILEDAPLQMYSSALIFTILQCGCGTRRFGLAPARLSSVRAGSGF